MKGISGIKVSFFLTLFTSATFSGFSLVNAQTTRSYPQKNPNSKEQLQQQQNPRRNGQGNMRSSDRQGTSNQKQTKPDKPIEEEFERAQPPVKVNGVN
jgi:hypothetical protein